MGDEIRAGWSEWFRDQTRTPSGTIKLIAIGLIAVSAWTWYQDRDADRTLKEKYFSMQIAATEKMTVAIDNLVDKSQITANFQAQVSAEHAATDRKIGLAEASSNSNGKKLDMLINSADQTNRLLGVVITLLEASAFRHSGTLKNEPATPVPGGT